MIDSKNHPLGWSSLFYELSDAHEHLGVLLANISGDPTYSEVEFRIELGHVYAHLNRAWYRRNIPNDFPESDRNLASSFPGDLDPVG